MVVVDEPTTTSNADLMHAAETISAFTPTADLSESKIDQAGQAPKTPWGRQLEGVRQSIFVLKGLEFQR